MALDVERFSIAIGDDVLADLRRRLEATRWPHVIPGSGWEYGVARDDLRALAEHWRTGFDWRAAERTLNELPHFRATVDGQRLHFIHERAARADALPLVLTHGWPGSFLEFVGVIGALAHPEAHGGSPDDAFHVVVPSLPGYGFSDPPDARGMDPERMAALWLALMRGLGYERFGAQGGDWGASISTRLALNAPDALVGLHLNYIPGSYRPFLGPGAPPVTPEEAAFVEAADRWHDTEGAYDHLQATRPDTVAYALTDSPVGLLAWILEKLRDWADCDGDLFRRISRDEVLAHVTLYWVTGTIAPANRLYYEARRNPIRLKDGQRVRVPTGILTLAKEAPAPPRSWVERGYDVVRWTTHPRGGHFAAMEEPEAFVEDVRAFFRPLRPWRKRPI